MLKPFFTFILSFYLSGFYADTISVNSSSFDFGTYPARNSQSHSFVLKNTGDFPVCLIQIKSTCGCLVPKFEKQKLSPGESYSLEVTLKANSVFGEFNRVLYLETDQTNQRYILLNVKGKAVPLVEITPKNLLYVGQLNVNKEYQYEFTLTPTEKNVTLELSALPKDTDAKSELFKEGNSYKLKITIKPTKPDMLITVEQQIKIVMPEDQPPMRIVLRGKTIK